jgi:cellulose synthase/poly-beta-1,6-N-acetylglucosamine synthase-like glycosyltransferase
VLREREDGWGDTALELAAASGNVEGARALLRAVSEPIEFARRKSRLGLTPAEVARAAGHALLASELECAANGKPLPVAFSLPPCRLSVDLSSDETELKGDVERGECAVSLQEYLVRGQSAARGREAPLGPLQRRRRLFRARVFLSAGLITSALYLSWRAFFSFPSSKAPWRLAYASIFYAAEIVLWLQSAGFAIEMWSPLKRTPRRLTKSLLAALVREPLSGEATEGAPGGGEGGSGAPSISVLVPCCNEPVEVVEGTLCAALSLDWPRLLVYLLDDSQDETRMYNLVRRLEAQRQSLGLKSQLKYIRRPKAAGVAHHAKAGNINHALLKGGVSGDYVLVLDADMVPRRELLLSAMGHFLRDDALPLLRRAADGLASGRGAAVPAAARRWRSLCRPKAGYLQLPQRFYNIPRGDPLGHASRFFYGPMLRGRDGCGACPCVGTGCIFARDALISNGGQAIGSITEDYKTSIQLLSGGFWSGYLEEDLVFGQAPEDMEGCWKQRFRWATGSLQIFFSETNPLLVQGLTLAQRVIFVISFSQYLMWLPHSVLVCTPLVYLYFFVSPMEADMIQFTAFFLLMFVTNRMSMYFICKLDGMSSLDVWRGSQAQLYMAPMHLAACFRLLTEKLRHCLSVGAGGGIAFGVTKKSVNRVRSGFLKNLWYVWPQLLYFAAAAGGVVSVAVRSLTDTIVWSRAEGLVGAENPIVSVALAVIWSAYILALIWPPVACLFPGSFRIESGEEDARVTDRVKWRNVLSLAGLSPRSPGPDAGSGTARERQPRSEENAKASEFLRQRALEHVLSDVEWPIVSPRTAAPRPETPPPTYRRRDETAPHPGKRASFKIPLDARWNEVQYLVVNAVVVAFLTAACVLQYSLFQE